MGVSQTSKSIHEISVSSSLDSHTQEPGDRTLSLTLRRVTQTTASPRDRTRRADFSPCRLLLEASRRSAHVDVPAPEGDRFVGSLT